MAKNSKPPRLKLWGAALANKPTGLILVDLQHAFHPDAAVVARIEQALSQYDFIVALRHINYPQSLFETELNFTRCYEGQPDAEIVIPLPGALVFDHASYGMETGQIEKLKAFEIDRWDIGGVDTHGCVLATCFNLFDHQVKFRVIKEYCHSSKGKDVQDAAFNIMELCFAQFQK